MAFLVFGFILGLSLVNGYTFVCPSGRVCVVNGSPHLTIVADKTVPGLIINCHRDGQCKPDNGYNGMKVYSSALDTKMRCDGDDSCAKVKLYCGITPANFDSINFIGFNRNTVVVECDGKQSCKGIEIYNKGVITKGLTVHSPNIKDIIVNKGALMSSITSCGTETVCTLDCGNDIETCKDVRCSGNCVCEGYGCLSAKLSSNNIMPPNNNNNNNNNIGNSGNSGNGGNSLNTGGVLPVPWPTYKPSPSPTEHRGNMSCSENNCIITPSENMDVYCPSYISGKCTIDCSTTESQCAEGVTVHANSGICEIICSSKGTCKDMHVYNKYPSNINIIVSDENAGTGMYIDISNKGSILNIIADGKEALGSGYISCDGTCNLKCNGINGDNACKDVKYECMSERNQCKCDFMNSDCPDIEYFGDSSCNSNTRECVIYPDGNTRIIAPNYVNTLTIICNKKPEQCKKETLGLKIYSAAKITKLLCNKLDSCDGALLFIGSLSGKYLPKGFDESDFIRSKKDAMTLNVNCDDVGACQDMSIYTAGNVYSDITGNGEEALADTSYICNNCKSLNVNCREFDGCVNTKISCTNIMSCSCFNAYPVFIENGTVTEAPRDGCPIIDQYNPTIYNIGELKSVNIRYDNNNNNERTIILTKNTKTK